MTTSTEVQVNHLKFKASKKWIPYQFLYSKTVNNVQGDTNNEYMLNKAKRNILSE